MSSEAGSSLERDPREHFPDRYNGAVLLADKIRYFSTSDDIPAGQRLIDPFEPARLRAASYQLTLGNQVHVGGIHHLMLDTKHLILEPHQVAVVSTREVLRIPRFLVARWSIRVRKIYEGLLWTGGLQVDLGWVGQLFCPIYNLAEQEIELRSGEGMFTIDFIRTTPLTAEYRSMGETTKFKKTWFIPELKTLAEHDSNRLHSAPYEALRDVRELTRFRDLALGAVALIFVVLGVMVAALGVLAARPVVDPGAPWLSAWPMTSLLVSVVALGLSAFSLAFAFKIYSGLRR
jgi:deoxycytidine triphosphate deaminase